MTLSVEVRTRLAGQVEITLRGELDQGTAGHLRDAVTAALATRPAQVCLDLAQVSFVDSSGLGTLVVVHKMCGQVGCRLALEGVGPTLHQRLQVTGLTGVFDLTGPPHWPAQNHG
ncbi:STAS domain-containing protein [Dactylosporangium roseum]|uniref:Anti-sigma factor antagonist n=1 Tax=Dactylosporangium roseum TaxID=47989 RepID=A0ABY5ZFZ2_9ACTN|nr:STAS domain-containing protein [Dactylosporangium roseum]UWZ39618.1 STAS domain-containing protein [Dactylosporangium roseum]